MTMSDGIAPEGGEAARPAGGGPTVADAVVAILQTEGVGFLSAYPNTPLIDAAARADLRPILPRQERIGAAIADGFSRVTGGAPPGVFAMQWGPGVENAYSGIATAFADSVPVLFLPSGYPSGREDLTRFYSAERLRPIAKSVERIREPRRVHEVMRRAFTRMRSGRPGPAVVEVPADVALMPMDSGASEYRRPTVPRLAGDPAAIDAAAAALVAARRPVIFAGAGALQSGATGSLIALAEQLDAPVATTLGGKSVFPESHPLSLGTAALSMPTPLRQAFDEADLVLGIGVSLTKHLLSTPPPAGATLVHVTIDEFDLNKDFPTEYPILGDARLVIDQLREALAERLQEPVARGSAVILAGRRAEWLAEWAPLFASRARPMTPYRIVDAICRVLDPTASILTNDSGGPRDQLLPFYRATVPHGYLGWGKSHALGSGLGLIMGAKLAAPEKICVNFMGDAAFGMVGLDFETAVRNGIPIITVVSSNGTMASETSIPVADRKFQSRRLLGNYTDLARAMGGVGYRVEDPGEVEPVLRQAVRDNLEGNAALVEVITTAETSPVSSPRW